MNPVLIVLAVAFLCALVFGLALVLLDRVETRIERQVAAEQRALNETPRRG